MITLTLRKWPSVGGVTHTATSYRIASDVAMTNILDENLNDSENVTVYRSPAIVPINVPYYTQIKRHFSDGNDTGWSEPTAKTKKAANNGVISSGEIFVYTPVVEVVNVTDPLSNTYTVSTSGFIGENDAHGYTIWSVLNDKDDIVEFVKSTTELTSITFNKDSNVFFNTKYLKFLAIHGTGTNVESPVGEAIVSTTTADFELAVKGTLQSSSKNLTVYINRDDENVIVSSVELQNSSGDIVWGTTILPTTTNILIPAYILSPNKSYTVVGTGATTDAVYKTYFETRGVYELDKLILSYKYNKTLSKRGTFPVISNLHTNEVYNAKTPIPVNGVVKYAITETNGSVTVLNKEISGISLTSTENDNCYIKSIGNSSIIVDTKTSTGYKLVTYDVDYYNDVATIRNYISGDGDSLVVNSGLVVIDKDIIITGRHGDTKLQKLDISGTTVEITDIPLPTGVVSVETIAGYASNNILLIGKGSGEIHNYNLSTETYEHKFTLPIEFRSRTLKAVKLINGDSLIWKPIRIEDVDGTNITDSIIEVLYIDSINNTTEHLVLTDTRDNDILGSVFTNTGKLLLIENSSINNNFYMFE